MKTVDDIMNIPRHAVATLYARRRMGALVGMEDDVFRLHLGMLLLTQEDFLASEPCITEYVVAHGETNPHTRALREAIIVRQVADLAAVACLESAMCLCCTLAEPNMRLLLDLVEAWTRELPLDVSHGLYSQPAWVSRVNVLPLEGQTRDWHKAEILNALLIVRNEMSNALSRVDSQSFVAAADTPALVLPTPILDSLGQFMTDSESERVATWEGHTRQLYEAIVRLCAAGNESVHDILAQLPQCEDTAVSEKDQAIMGAMVRTLASMRREASSSDMVYQLECVCAALSGELHAHPSVVAYVANAFSDEGRVYPSRLDSAIRRRVASRGLDDHRVAADTIGGIYNRMTLNKTVTASSAEEFLVCVAKILKTNKGE